MFYHANFSKVEEKRERKRKRRKRKRDAPVVPLKDARRVIITVTMCVRARCEEMIS